MDSRTIDCLLIADDLTGACDAAAPFAARGRRSVVLLDPSADPGDAHVIAVSTDSRDATPAQVAPAMAATWARVAAHSARVLFKKIDSTLRGNTALEIHAALDAFGCRAAVVCPAFPAMRRVVSDGHLKITSASDFGPIHLETHLRCAHVKAGEIRAALERGERVVSLDAGCDADLDQLTAEILAIEGQILWTGSAGLAAALARSIGGGSTVAPKPPCASPVLFCIGSNHAVTIEQERALRSARNIAETVKSGAHALIRIPSGRVGREQLRQRIIASVPAALMLSGGDTAALVCRAIGVHSIELCDELIPGIPRGILRGGDFDGLPVVTKSGGFGNPDALIQIADYFSCPN
jgi:uncharacterized protein YgbK (DUF1537 family)